MGAEQAAGARRGRAASLPSTGAPPPRPVSTPGLDNNNLKCSRLKLKFRCIQLRCQLGYASGQSFPAKPW